MANRQKALISVAMYLGRARQRKARGQSVWSHCSCHSFSFTYSEIAHARPNPSYVLVPRPNSSMIIRDLDVADYGLNGIQCYG